MIGTSKNVKLDVNGQIIHYVSFNDIVADSVNYLQCRFTFTEDWGEGVKYCLFYDSDRTKKPVKATVVKGNGENFWYCTVPHEVIHSPCFHVSVYDDGSNTEQSSVMITTNMVKIDVRDSGYDKEPDAPLQPAAVPEMNYLVTPNNIGGVPYIKQTGGVLEYSVNGGEWNETKTREILPTDITGQTLDLNQYTSENGYGLKSWQCRTNGGTANISNLPEKTAFLLEHIPSFSNPVTGEYGGLQMLTVTHSTGGPRRQYTRWYNKAAGQNTVFGQWTLIGTMSTTLTTITIAGTASYVNAEIAKLPRILNHNLTVNITDGDYLTETIVLTNLICNGNITIQAETSVSSKEAVKAVKLKNINVTNCQGLRLSVNYINFQGGSAENCITVSVSSGSIYINYCDFRYGKTAVDNTTYYGISLLSSNKFNLYTQNCRFYWLDRGVNLNAGNTYLCQDCSFYDSTYGVRAVAGGQAHMYGANIFTQVQYPTYRESAGLITDEVQTFKVWKSGDYTGVSNEFVFVKILQSGVYRVTLLGGGYGFVGVYSWEIYNGYNDISVKSIGQGLPGPASPINISLSYSKISAQSYLLKATCTNPTIGANANNFSATVAPYHFTANDGYVLFNPTDTPATWVDIN